MDQLYLDVVSKRGLGEFINIQLLNKQPKNDTYNNISETDYVRVCPNISILSVRFFFETLQKNPLYLISYLYPEINNSVYRFGL